MWKHCIAFYLNIFVAYSTSEICIQKDTKDMLQAIKGWYSATTYITPKKIKTHKTKTNDTYIYIKNN